MKTSLEPYKEVILMEISPIISKWAKKLKTEESYVERSVAYLWEDRKQQKAKEWDDYLRANDMGPYGGR